MTTTKKATVLAILSVFLLVLIQFSSYATNISGIMPRWNGVGNVNTSLAFYGDEGEAIASIDRGDTVTSLNGTLTVYKYVNGAWICVDSVTKSTTRATLSMMIVFDGISNVEYKMELVVTAYNGTSVIEEITDVKYARCS